MSNFKFKKGIPNELVGSLPRPAYLQKGFKEFEAGNITHEELKQLQNKATRETIKELEKTGSEVIVGGEQSKSSFATYPVVDTLGGVGLNKSCEPGGQYFAIFADGHHRQLPKLVSGPFEYGAYTADWTKTTVALTTFPIKESVIAPSMLSLLYPLNEEIEGYTREEFETDLVKECVKDIKLAFAAGAARVTIDFTEGRLALKDDPKNPWTQKAKLSGFINLINRVLDEFSTQERINIGIHTCPGGDEDSTHSADVPYNSLFRQLFQINAGYFLIQCASERNKEQVYKDIASSLPKDSNGVKPVAFIGVINGLNPRIETPEEIARQLVLAAKYIPKDQLGATDDCGFSPFSIDEKPNHGDVDKARKIAFEKITNRIKGAELASKQLGLL